MRGFPLITFLFLLSAVSFSQSKSLPAKKPKANEINDFVCTLHEETINKVLTAVGDVSGSSDYEVMLISGKYHWTIQNAKINIRPDSSHFVCDALVKVSMFEYKTKVIGNVKINYDDEKNLIYLRISRAIFPLYTEVFGKKVHIKDIHLEDHFKEPFAFEGPRTMATDMEFTMPDSTKKKIYVVPTQCKMELKWKEICTSCEISACEMPALPPIKLQPPIEAVPPATLQVAPSGTTQPLQAQKK